MTHIGDFEIGNPVYYILDREMHLGIVSGIEGGRIYVDHKGDELEFHARGGLIVGHEDGRIVPSDERAMKKYGEHEARRIQVSRIIEMIDVIRDVRPGTLRVWAYKIEERKQERGLNSVSDATITKINEYALADFIQDRTDYNTLINMSVNFVRHVYETLVNIYHG